MSLDFSKSESLLPFLETFNGETDRSCAVLAVILLDKALEVLLQKSFVEDTPDDIFKGYAPLSSFSAKIDFSYYMGLISKGEKEELNRIRKIRNIFAHSIEHELTDLPPLK